MSPEIIQRYLVMLERALTDTAEISDALARDGVPLEAGLAHSAALRIRLMTEAIEETIGILQMAGMTKRVGPQGNQQGASLIDIVRGIARRGNVQDPG